MAVWTVAWSPRTRQHCIHHHPGPCNRWFIGHSFCPTSKGERVSWKQAEQFTITMQTEECHCQWLRPLSGTGKRPHFRLYLGTRLFLMCYNLSLELPPHCHDLSGGATSHLATRFLEVGHLILPASTQMEDKGISTPYYPCSFTAW